MRGNGRRAKGCWVKCRVKCWFLHSLGIPSCLVHMRTCMASFSHHLYMCSTNEAGMNLEQDRPLLDLGSQAYITTLRLAWPCSLSPMPGALLLSLQVHSMVEKLAQFTDVSVALIVGGLSLQVQVGGSSNVAENACMHGACSCVYVCVKWEDSRMHGSIRGPAHVHVHFCMKACGCCCSY